ncbi:MAG: exosortase H-associated membrane protein [Rhodocyclaceae bacterium]
MKRSLSVVGGLFAGTLLWLIPALALWYWGREWVVQPPAWAAEQVFLRVFPAWVLGSKMEGGDTLVLLTALTVNHPSGQLAELGVPVQVLKYCYGLPLYAALLLASRAHGLWWKLPVGAFVIALFQAWGVVFDLLVAIAVHLGPVTEAQTGFGFWHVNGFAVARQIGYLLFPSLVPVMLWLALERRFLATVLMEGTLVGATAKR